MVRNKFGRCRRNLGYLPVDVADEGKPLAAPPQLARNPETDALHQRTSALASRLAVLTASQPAEPRDEVAEVKSPAQLMNQVQSKTAIISFFGSFLTLGMAENDLPFDPSPLIIPRVRIFGSQRGLDGL